MFSCGWLSIVSGSGSLAAHLVIEDGELRECLSKRSRESDNSRTPIGKVPRWNWNSSVSDVLAFGFDLN